MSVRCFWLEPTGRVFVERSGDGDAGKNECQGWRWHHAVYHRETRDVGLPLWDDQGKSHWGDFPDVPLPEEPLRCEFCGQMFAPTWRGGSMCAEYTRTDTGEALSVNDAPPGAMWNAPWYRSLCNPTADGRYLIVRLPDGHDWCIDARASNCTMRDDKVHHCWVRRGEPPNLHVDKSGFTCRAGAGSIQTNKWHGFLHNGALVPY